MSGHAVLRKVNSRVLSGIVAPKVTYEEAADLDGFISTGIFTCHVYTISTEMHVTAHK